MKLKVSIILNSWTSFFMTSNFSNSNCDEETWRSWSRMIFCLVSSCFSSRNINIFGMPPLSLWHVNLPCLGRHWPTDHHHDENFNLFIQRDILPTCEYCHSTWLLSHLTGQCNWDFAKRSKSAATIRQRKQTFDNENRPSNSFNRFSAISSDRQITLRPNAFFKAIIA